MDPFATSHFSDDALLHDAKRLLGLGFKTDAMLLTRITEIDRRQLYRREGYPSMYSYMIQEWHLTEDAAYKRIHAARAALRFPAVLIALAEGRLYMRGVLMLARHLTSGNADELGSRRPRTRAGSRSSSCWPSAFRSRICRSGCRPSVQSRRPRRHSIHPRGC
jgi:hypothetical protein